SKLLISRVLEPDPQEVPLGTLSDRGEIGAQVPALVPVAVAVDRPVDDQGLSPCGRRGAPAPRPPRPPRPQPGRWTAGRTAPARSAAIWRRFNSAGLTRKANSSTVRASRTRLAASSASISF